jgi:hypothetical protein
MELPDPIHIARLLAAIFGSGVAAIFRFGVALGAFLMSTCAADQPPLLLGGGSSVGRPSSVLVR